jgi:transposase, IS30 family
MTKSAGRPKKRGCEPLADKRDQYLRLMAQGMSNSAACRQVGVNRRTGNRWRYGRKVVDRAGREYVYPPITEQRDDGAVSPRFLSEDERIAIADLLRAVNSPRAIARQLGRNPATISREIRRNSHPRTGKYHPFYAQRRTVVRRARSKDGKIRREPPLKEYIQRRLNQHWSPEQISQALRTAFPDEPERHLAHETIYQAIYLTYRGGLDRQPAALRTGRQARRRRRDVGQRAARLIDPGTLIDQRPTEIDDRLQPGSWEGDLIMGTGNRSAIGTLVERTTRYVMLLHLPDGRTAEHVRDALVRAFADLPPTLARSLTWDQGTEMSRHDEFTRATNIPVYFCDPASPWQRGSNENTNGLLRQYFPKGTDLSLYHAEGYPWPARTTFPAPTRSRAIRPSGRNAADGHNASLQRRSRGNSPELPRRVLSGVCGVTAVVERRRRLVHERRRKDTPTATPPVSSGSRPPAWLGVFARTTRSRDRAMPDLTASAEWSPRANGKSMTFRLATADRTTIVHGARAPLRCGGTAGPPGSGPPEQEDSWAERP